MPLFTKRSLASAANRFLSCSEITRSNTRSIASVSVPACNTLCARLIFSVYTIHMFVNIANCRKPGQRGVRTQRDIFPQIVGAGLKEQQFRWFNGQRSNAIIEVQAHENTTAE